MSSARSPGRCDFWQTTSALGHKREDLTDEPVKFWSVFSYLVVYDAAMTPLGIARVLHGSRDLETISRGSRRGLERFFL